jgi:hypothetical protein
MMCLSYTSTEEITDLHQNAPNLPLSLQFKGEKIISDAFSYSENV